jgi:catechol 2,3-dioxygenase-like lactoylglutathione lyase family enzyme
VLGVWHFSFTVEDIDRSLDFYCGLLGLELVRRQVQDNAYTRRLVGYPDADLEVAQLAVPGQPRGISTHDLELVSYRRPRGVRGDLATPNPGVAHMAFAVEDAVATYTRLLSHGVVFVSPPNLIEAGVNRGGHACYFRDPDGITLELVQPPPGRIRGGGLRVI